MTWLRPAGCQVNLQGEVLLLGQGQDLLPGHLGGLLQQQLLVRQKPAFAQKLPLGLGLLADVRGLAAAFLKNYLANGTAFFLDLDQKLKSFDLGLLQGSLGLGIGLLLDSFQHDFKSGQCQALLRRANWRRW